MVSGFHSPQRCEGLSQSDLNRGISLNFLDQLLVAYFIRFLRVCPYLKNSHGIGAIMTVQLAKVVVAHPTPRPWYICNANMGKAADKEYRVSIAAPAAEAP
jgi:hypothetical protein